MHIKQKKNEKVTDTRERAITKKRSL